MADDVIRDKMLKFLIKSLGYKEKDIKGNGNKNFDNRLKIQKIVYLLKKYVGDTSYFNYNYNLYVRGPYSKELADAYYAIRDRDLSDVDPSNVPDDVLDLIDKIKKIDPFELEIMATLLLLKENNSLEDALYITTKLKHDRLKANSKNDEFVKNEEVNKLKSLGFRMTQGGILPSSKNYYFIDANGLIAYIMDEDGDVKNAVRGLFEKRNKGDNLIMSSTYV